MPDTGLYDASVAGDGAAVRAILASDPQSVHEADEYGFTALHGVASEEHYAVARLLIEAGADVNARNDEGITPLHLASRPEMIDLLLEHGADINAVSDEGYTPLHVMASEPEREDVLERLLERGADPTLKNRFGATPADIARTRGEQEKVDLLAHYGG